MKKKVLNIPFVVDSSNNKKTYKLMNEEQIGGKIFKNKYFINMIQNMLDMNKNKNNNIKYIKASSTKEYYEKIKNKK